MPQLVGRLPTFVLPVLWLAAVSCAAQDETPFDLLIIDGRVVDGTGNPWFIGSVGIRGDRIEFVGRRSEQMARRTINAKGLTVAPGFIDIHSHSDLKLLEDGHAQSKVRQGVTTEILGEGSSAGPRQGKLGPQRVSVDGESKERTRLDGYFRTLSEFGTATNVASYVGLGTVWRCVMGDSFDTPTEEEVRQMEGLVEEAMQHGALGLSSQVMMPPGSLATTEHIVRLCRIVARYDGIYSTHIRNEGLGVFESVAEAIAVGEMANLPVDVIHLKIADQKFWGRMHEIVRMIEDARDRGVNVQANVYPYTRGNNNLVSIIPPWAHEGGRNALVKRLRDPKQRPRLKRDITSGIEGWYNHYTAVGGDWSRMLVSANNSYRGLTMDRVMQLRLHGRQNVDPLDELFDLLIEQSGSVSAVYAHHTEDDMRLALQQPWCSIGSDGSAYAIEGPLRRGNPHPRNFGTFPRVLGVYVRENGVLRLEEAVRKMTSLNAAKVGLADRGLLREGSFADVTIFDAARVLDRATFTAPFQYPAGIEYVIVNGEVVLEGDDHTGRRPGCVLRHNTNK